MVAHAGEKIQWLVRFKILAFSLGENQATRRQKGHVLTSLYLNFEHAVGRKEVINT